MRSIAALLALIAVGCVTDRSTSSGEPVDNPAADNTCWSWCEWPMPAPPCLAQPDTIEYLKKLNAYLNLRTGNFLSIPIAECSCISFGINTDGSIRDINVAKSTNLEASQFIANVIVSAGPYPPPPDGALCLARSFVRFSVGGEQLPQ